MLVRIRLRNRIARVSEKIQPAIAITRQTERINGLRTPKIRKMAADKLGNTPRQKWSEKLNSVKFLIIKMVIKISRSTS